MYKFYYRFVTSLIGIAVKQNAHFVSNIEALASIYGSYVDSFEAACEELVLQCEEL